MIGMPERRRPRVTVLATAGVVGNLFQQVQAIAASTECVLFSHHARERMVERDVTDVEVIKVLRHGHVEGAPWIEPRGSDMACKVVQRQPGGRKLGVVTIVLTARGRLLVKTVEWEDVK